MHLWVFSRVFFRFQGHFRGFQDVFLLNWVSLRFSRCFGVLMGVFSRCILDFKIAVVVSKVLVEVIGVYKGLQEF